MKRWTGVLAASVIAAALVLGGCTETRDGPGSAPPEGSTGGTTVSPSAEGGDADPKQTFFFRVNDEMPEYACDVTLSEGQAAKIEIVVKETDDHVQTIVPPSNEAFTEEAAYFADVTFRDEQALILPVERSASSTVFLAYLWDEEQMQFLEEPSFKNIKNPSIDFNGKRILSKTSGDKITTYSMYSFENGQFVLTNSLYWEPADLGAGAAPDVSGQMHVVETEGETVKKEAVVPAVDDYTVDHDAPQVSGYFATGSFWDLDGEKWTNTVWR